MSLGLERISKMCFNRMNRVSCVYLIIMLFNSRLPQIYEEFYHTVSNADHEKDLRWWSNTNGVNMPMAWPQFEVSVR